MIMMKVPLLFLLILNPALFQIENKPSIKLVERIELQEVIKPGRKLQEENGKFYVLSGFSVYCFDGEGRLLSTLGRRGTGPGEFIGVRDFLVTPGGNVLVGGWTAGNKGKISIFDQSGLHRKDHVVPYMVDQVFFHEDRVFFVTRDVVFHSLKNGTDRFDHLTLDLFEVGNPVPILTLPDKSRINPPHFSGKAYPYPWFPGPYPESIFIFSLEGDFFIFQGKKEYVIKLHDNIKTKVPFKFVMPRVAVTEKDIQEYFDRIESVNEKKIKSNFKRNIEFPKIKNNFSDILMWGPKFVLFTKRNLILVSSYGRLIEKFKLPSEFNEREPRINGNSADLIFFSKKFIYTLSDDGIMSKYEWLTMRKYSND